VAARPAFSDSQSAPFIGAAAEHIALVRAY